ncbi:SDR family oxidoreductase [Rhodococcus sp. IEGM 1408]|uniref:SDR family oxidoreductase n=1 Tax=Rhodococcus sp. IEGM 1408 TaxID=3082220 RepID=UPI0029532741|nr:SDR family oxidoreductase [Rhodococcus sp. IEGM 1408]MDV8002492.1 SDR family oxidoreductase [Rhodococcus sp. IEGM 1408]
MANIDLGLSGKVVLVTGGVRGVGAGISRVFRECGAVVVTCARRPADQGSDVADLEFHPVDLRDPEAVRAMVDAIVSKHGRLDVVVNNAGGAPFALAADASANFHAKIVALNLLSALTVSQEAHRVMTAAGSAGGATGGAIVNISSVSGHRPSPGTASYGAAKAGIDSLTQSLAVEWAPAVRINSVVVGPVKTELAEMHYGDSDGVAAVDATIPMGRMADPRDVGQAAAFLASPLAAYITGAELLVHGGGEKPAFLSASTAENKH